MSKDTSSLTVAGPAGYVACVGDHFSLFSISLVHITSSQAGDYTASYFKSLMMSACFLFGWPVVTCSNNIYPKLILALHHYKVML